MYKIFTRITIAVIKSFLWIIDTDHRSQTDIGNNDVKKFTHMEDVDFQSDFGRATKVYRTIPYRAWLLKTETHELIAADKHIVINSDGQQVWLMDLCIGDKIKTDTGIEVVTLIRDLGVQVHMYDIEIDNQEHLYYTNGILSHNTETSAAFMLWWAIFHEDQRVFIASYKADAAKAIMKRIKFMYEELPWWIKPGIVMKGGWNVMSIEFDNGSSVMADTTTENTGRGLPINLFFLDEFAYVHPSIAEAFWTSIYPTISSSDKGRCIITSTANTDEDKFAQIWFNSLESKFSYNTNETKRIKETSGDEEVYETIYEDVKIKQEEVNEKDDDTKQTQGFYGFHAPWYAKPGRDTPDSEESKKYKQSVLSAGYSETQWKRDYECQFITGDATLISPTKLLSLNSYIRKPRFIDRWGMRWYEEILPNKSYGVILDPSEGVGRDDACIQVMQLPDMIQVAEWNNNQADQAEQAKMLYRTIRRIYKIQTNDPDYDRNSLIYYSVECNGIGIGVLTSLEIEYEYKIPGYLIDSEGNKLRGIRMTTNMKRNRCLDMASLIERNIFIPRSKHLISQLKTFVQRRQGVYAAKNQCKDDLVMSIILMMQLIEELRSQDADIQDTLMLDITETYDTSDADDLRESDKPFVIFG